MTTLNQWKTWVKKLGYAEKKRLKGEPRPGSRPAAEQRQLGTPHQRYQHDGTSDRDRRTLALGELIPLTVEVERLSEDRSEPQITVQARVARYAPDGIGLEFVLPEGLDPNIWTALLTGAIVLEGPKDALYD